MRFAVSGTLRTAALVAALRKCSSPQAVYRVQPGRFLLIPDGSPRLEALLRSREFSRRIVGVFSPDVQRAILASELA